MTNDIDKDLEGILSALKAEYKPSYDHAETQYTLGLMF